MKRKALSIVLAISVLFALFSVPVLANDNVGNMLKDAGNTISRGAKDVGNVAGTAVEGIGNGISDIGTGISGTARDMTSGTSTNNGSYTATRTSTPATFAGMGANTWAWLIVAVFGAIIIGFVWFYGQQHQTEEFHSQDQ